MISRSGSTTSTSSSRTTCTESWLLAASHRSVFKPRLARFRICNPRAPAGVASFKAILRGASHSRQAARRIGIIQTTMRVIWAAAYQQGEQLQRVEPRQSAARHQPKRHLPWPAPIRRGQHFQRPFLNGWHCCLGTDRPRPGGDCMVRSTCGRDSLGGARITPCQAATRIEHASMQSNTGYRSEC